MNFENSVSCLCVNCWQCRESMFTFFRGLEEKDFFRFFGCGFLRNCGIRWKSVPFRSFLKKLMGDYFRLQCMGLGSDCRTSIFRVQMHIICARSIINSQLGSLLVWRKFSRSECNHILPKRTPLGTVERTFKGRVAKDAGSTLDDWW